MKKPDFIFIMLIAILAVLIWGSGKLWPYEGGLTAEIIVKGETVATVSLHEYVEDVPVPGVAMMTYTVDRHGIAINSSDCPDQICVQTGAINQCGQTILCVPHQVMIRIVGGSEEPKTDAILY